MSEVFAQTGKRFPNRPVMSRWAYEWYPLRGCALSLDASENGTAIILIDVLPRWRQNRSRNLGGPSALLLDRDGNLQQR